MGSGAAIKEADWSMLWVHAMNLNGQMMQFAAIHLCSDTSNRWQLFKQLHAFAVLKINSMTFLKVRAGGG